MRIRKLNKKEKFKQKLNLNYSFSFIIQIQIFQKLNMQIRIKKRTSISKNNNKEKPFNLTMSTAIFPTSTKQIKPLPPIRRNLRKPLQKLQASQKQFKMDIKPQRKQTQTTLGQSMMMQTYFSTMSKGWVKPSDYLNDIKSLNLFQCEQQDKLASDYQVKLNDKVQKNLQRIKALFNLTQKWVDILKKALVYLTSQRSNSQKISEQLKFWRLLSKKFDQLEYQFNNQKTIKLYFLMKTSLKTSPQYRQTFIQFERLKQKVISKSIIIKRLYLTLQQVLCGLIIKFQQNSCLKKSIQLLKQILFCFNNVKGQDHDLLRNRLQLIYKKIDLALVQKLISSPIYPKQLANISTIKQKYQLLNQAMSFLSNFISILEQQSQPQQPKCQQSNYSSANNKYQQIIYRAEYTRSIISNLMEILCYFQYLYKNKEVLEFSKLFGYQIDFNIFDLENQKSWKEYMEIVMESMQKKAYEV